MDQRHYSLAPSLYPASFLSLHHEYPPSSPLTHNFNNWNSQGVWVLPYFLPNCQFQSSGTPSYQPVFPASPPAESSLAWNRSSPGGSPFNTSSTSSAAPRMPSADRERPVKQEERQITLKLEDEARDYATAKEPAVKEEASPQLAASGPKVPKKMKRKTIDKEYIPHRSEKKESRRRLHENENRNVVPNEINQILSFLQKRSKSEHILVKIWARQPPVEESFSISRFYLYQGLLKEKSGHYSNEQQLKLLGSLYQPQCRIWSTEQQRHYITLGRMLVGHFLRQDCIPIILTSKRMQSAKKRQHLTVRREVAKRVLQLIGARPLEDGLRKIETAH